MAEYAASEDGDLELGLPLDDADLTNLTQTRARPLFAPSRRQPLPPPAPIPRPVAIRLPAPPVPPPPPDIHLLGVIAIGGKRTALVAIPGTGTVRLKTGEQYEGWTATIPNLKTLEFQMAGRSQTFRLFEPK
ncbi:hypothetical protein [Aurantimonas manganoxydans]|uniref:hypothetical protein n=1 Tax=Aurantimonas manganoxydans TaxID=651183 RepID=UPI0011D246E6|nr:hypothetical protein [Aurantimonas manganoxydans]